MAKPGFGYVLLALFILLRATPTCSQWRLVASFGSPVFCVHFLDDEGAPDIGFVGLANGMIVRTTDRGKTWGDNYSTIPTMGVPAPVADFAFKDSKHGWAVGSIDVFATTDGGSSWKPIGLGRDVHALYYHKAQNTLYANGLNICFASNDAGMNWRSIGPKKTLGMAFTNATTGIRTAFDTNYFYTADGGLSWHDCGFGAECWQPTAFGTGNIFLATSETFIGTDLIYKTLDGGQNWFQASDFRSIGKLTGTIRSESNLAYLQSDDGLYLSRDTGRIWMPICGPSNEYDTRFYLHGDTIFAGGKNGLYMTPRASQGPLDERVTFTPSILNLYTVDCANEISQLWMYDSSNCHQSYLHILELRLTGPNNLPSVNFRIRRPIAIPGLFFSDAPLEIEYTPGSRAYDTAYLFIKCEENDKEFTRTIPIYGFVLPTLPYIVSPQSISKVLLDPCRSFDTTFTISNNRCDSLFLESAEFDSAQGLSFDSLDIPHTIAPDSSYTIHIHYQPQEKGVFPVSMYLNIRKGFSESQAEVKFLFNVVNDVIFKEALLPPKTNFGYINLCQDPVRRKIIFRNDICKDFEITKITMTQSANDYRFTKLLSLPDTLSSGELDTIELECIPLSSGVKNATIFVQSKFNNHTIDTFMSITAIGTASIATNLADTLLDFGTISTCDSVTIYTSVVNSSCDSVQLNFVRGLTSGIFRMIDPPLGYWLKAGETKKIFFRYIPHTPGSSYEPIELFMTQARAALSLPLVLQGSASSEATSLRVSQPIIDFGIHTPCDVLDSSITIYNPMQCDTIRIDSIWTSANRLLFSIDKRVLAPGNSSTISFGLLSDSIVNGDSVYCRISSRYGGVVDTSILVKANIIGKRKELIVQETSYDFGQMSLCDERDTTFLLKNNGCDTLHISDFSILGAGFFSTALSDFSIKPFDSTAVVIHAHVDTTSHPSINSAIISFVSDEDRSRKQLGLRSAIRYPESMQISFITEKKILLPGMKTSIALKTNRAMAPGLQSLDIVADYNSDVISYLRPSGGNTITTSNAKTFHITGNPDILFANDSTIGSLEFQVFLTRDTITEFSSVSLIPNKSSPEFEECLLSVSSAPGTIYYGLECGYKMIRESLFDHTISFKLVGIRPMPAHNELTLVVESSKDQLGAIELHSATGTTILNQSISLPIGSNTTTLDISDAPSGSYILTIRTAEESVSRIIVKER